jgi:hypothetical protein
MQRACWAGPGWAGHAVGVSHLNVRLTWQAVRLARQAVRFATVSGRPCGSRGMCGSRFATVRVARHAAPCCLGSPDLLRRAVGVAHLDADLGEELEEEEERHHDVARREHPVEGLEPGPVTRLNPRHQQRAERGHGSNAVESSPWFAREACTCALV